MVKKRLCLFLLFFVFMPQCLVGCGEQKIAITDGQARNLQKLGRVWGFTVFTHQSFLLGLKNWDDELLELIPVVLSAGEGEANGILYEWFAGLGEDGYDLDWKTYRSDLLAYYEKTKESLQNLLVELASDTSDRGNFYEDIVQSQLQATNDAINFVLEYGEVFNWDTMEVFTEELYKFRGAEMNLRPMADTNWINESYLGELLCTVLSRFRQIQIVDLTNAPVCFDILVDNSTFTNKNDFPDMDFSDEKYRLLGLFRLWNVMEYYFPYMDIMDDCWHELLLEFIPKMIEGTDRLSYELTLAELTSKLHDAHINFSGTESFLNERFGSFAAPVALAEVEGKLVVTRVNTTYESLLTIGDIILNLNGTDINEVATDMLKYLPYPNDGKALSYMVRGFDVLRSHTSDMKIGVLRDGEELTFSVTGFERYFAVIGYTQPASPHEVLDNNIGLINPAMLAQGDIHQIMKELADTEGLIIDLRQYPSWPIIYELAEYLVHEKRLFAIVSSPLQSIPGVFTDSFWGYSGGINSPDAYFYDGNIAILMNEWTQSQSEFTVMSLRNGSNVTVIGSNSIGADGNITNLPLPGGINMIFTGLGVYTSEGRQTQRIGLSPDIYVNRTIAGIKEGRDEIMEAAIFFLLRNK